MVKKDGKIEKKESSSGQRRVSIRVEDSEGTPKELHEHEESAGGTGSSKSDNNDQLKIAALEKELK